MTTKHMTMKLIHHGHAEFDMSLFKPVANQYFIKPEGGLWACPVESNHNWRQWCEAEGYRTDSLSTSFEFVFTGRVLVINSAMDIAPLPWLPDPRTNYLSIDFESLAREGIDAIWLTAHGERDTRWSKPSLYGWDCESVLIMNADGIQIERRTP